jgi:RNA polymerase sigma-70 factor (ECF subfamily)
MTSGDLAFNVHDCLARVRQEDQDAARLLVDHLYPTVIRIVRGNLPRRAAEEDLAQEIFVKIFSKLDQYAGEVPLEHWVSRIAVNHSLNALRFQSSRPEWRMADLSEEQTAALEAATTAPQQEADPAHLLGAHELVEKLLDALSPKDRLLMRMLEMEERSVNEVRQLTGWSAAAIRVRAFRARRKLRRMFGKLRKEGRL